MKVVEEAIAKGCNLIVQSSSANFKGLKQVTDDTALGRLVIN
nr:Nif3-like dinuclear metal center hexameric protein [Veillonella criceti]